MISNLDASTRGLVRIAAAIAGGDERTMRAVMEENVAAVDAVEVEEVILQSYLFAGFPRTLNAARIWRTVSARPAPEEDPDALALNASEWVRRGEETCAVVYGTSYELLRRNIRALHPALDQWMITDGYGKVLSRPELSLRVRELCIVAACAASAQQRQLHSHLHGALNAGANANELEAVLEAIADLSPRRELAKYRSLLDKVLAKRQGSDEHPVPTPTRNRVS
ncbi:MAG TPA: carboxymuconolactone decarboxylase family protein [Gemmatimonadaceae bacterium]